MDEQAVVLANEDTLSSMADGLVDIHWSQALGACFGARAIRAFVNIVALEGSSPQVYLVGRWSVDGKSWTNFNYRITANALTAIGTTAVQYASEPTEFAPQVQFGIAVEGSGGVARAKITAIIEPVFDDSAVVEYEFSAGDTLVGGTANPLPIGASTQTIVKSFRTATLIFTVSVLGTGVPTLMLQGSRDGTNWYTIQATVATAAITYALSTDYLPKHVRAAYTCTAGTNSTASAHFTLKQD